MCIAHTTTHIAAQLLLISGIYPCCSSFPQLCDYCLASRRTQSRRIAIKRPSQSGYMLSQCVFLKLPVCVLCSEEIKAATVSLACIKFMPASATCRKKRQMRRRCSVCAQPELRDESEKCTSRHRKGELGSLSDSISMVDAEGRASDAQPPAPLDHY